VARKVVIQAVLLCLGAVTSAGAEALWHAGPLWEQFNATLSGGERTEAFGPFFQREDGAESGYWAVPPLCSAQHDTGADRAAFDLLYPLLTFDRAGTEYRWQFLQVLSFSGGENQAGAAARRFTLFPFYFQQRSTAPDQNYTALWPVWGRLQDRLFRSEIEFALWPLYVKTVKRAGAAAPSDGLPSLLPGQEAGAPAGAVTTWNYLCPLVHVRRGDGLAGWQVWPFAGAEHQTVLTRTNGFGDVETVGGHEKRFVLWPLFFEQTLNTGTDSPEHTVAWLPFYTRLRSPGRDSTSYLWPLGLTITDDRARQYREVDAPWPLVVFARGAGKTTSRVWPFYSHAASTNRESGFYLWPLYKYNRLHAPPLEVQRSRVLLFAVSETVERHLDRGVERRRLDVWPLVSHQRDLEGNTRLQVLAPLEPLLPGNPAIERSYSPLWSLWRAEHNARTGRSSRSLLWNLYRGESGPEGRGWSLLFGLVRYESDSQGRRLRLFYLPAGRRDVPRGAAGAGQP